MVIVCHENLKEFLDVSEIEKQYSHTNRSMNCKSYTVATSVVLGVFLLLQNHRWVCG